MGTITMSVDTWWEIIICFGTILTGIIYIVFSVAVFFTQFKNKINEPGESEKPEAKVPEQV